MKRYCIGIDVGGTKCAFGLFDEDDTLVARHRIPTRADTTQKEFVEDVATAIETFLGEQRVALANVEGISLAMPSYVDSDNGVVVTSSNIPNLSSFPARDMFSARLPGVRIVVDNDTNVAALAEHRWGAGRGFKHLVYTAISTGIGSGFIINNELFRGAYGGAGESGHMIVNPDGGIGCGCENSGCVMSYASGSMICRHIRKAIAEGKKTLMTSLAGSAADITPETLIAAYALDDDLAVTMLDQMGRYIGIYVYNLFIAFNFNCYIFGGGLVKMGEPLFSRIRNTFDAYNHQPGQKIFIKTAELGDDCGIIGAAALLREGRENTR